jgi:hypothetical protein
MGWCTGRFRASNVLRTVAQRAAVSSDALDVEEMHLRMGARFTKSSKVGPFRGSLSLLKTVSSTFKLRAQAAQPEADLTPVLNQDAIP